MFPLIYGMPCNSSRFERYSCLNFVPLVSGIKPHGVGACVIVSSFGSKIDRAKTIDCEISEKFYKIPIRFSEREL